MSHYREALNCFREEPSAYWLKMIRDWDKRHLNTVAISEQARIVRAYCTQSPTDEMPMLDVLLAFAFTKYVQEHRQRAQAGSARVFKRQIKARNERIARQGQTTLTRLNALKTKSAAFDRIVEMLDHMRIGDKLMGDCNKADLLREAVRLEQAAGAMTMQVAFLKELAGLVGPTSTVRQATNRGGIVALLTSRFQDAA